MAVIGLVLLVGLVGLGLGSSLSRFWDEASMAIVVGFLVGSLIASFGKDGIRALRAVLSRTASREDLTLGLAFNARTRSYVVAGGTLGTLGGFMYIWRNLDDPVAIGAVMALGMLTQIYPVLLVYAILLPVTSSLERRLAELDS